MTVRPRHAVFLALLLLLLPAGWARADAAIAMPDKYSATAAADVLTAGGNAVDAAVAAAFVLAVTYPEAGNIGGGGFMLSVMHNEPQFLDFREMAPRAAHRDMFLDAQGEFQQRSSLVGGLASGVPGTVRGLQLAHARYGSLAWESLLAPAIALARDGFVVPESLAMAARKKSADVGMETNFTKYFGGLHSGGGLFHQPELAATLARIAADPDDFYSGETARLLLAQMEKTGGLITARDLEAYTAKWRAPLQMRWRQFTVLSAPPPSSGGVALMQLLGMRDAVDDLFAGRDHNSAPYLHLLAELNKRVFADRARYLGDPDHVEVPTDALLDANYLASLAGSIETRQISQPAETGTVLESPDTTHFSILDHDGNAVALTYTLNWDFGSSVVVEGAGFLLNNEMDDFSAKPGVPNAFGVTGFESNAIAPGKRMLSSMTPTILLENNRPGLIIGTPGGSTIFTSVFQVILNLYDFDMPLQDAVDATRFHHQLPEADLLRHDPRPIADETCSALEAMGYRVKANAWGNLGNIQAIEIREERIQAAADKRGRGVAFVLSKTPD